MGEVESDVRIMGVKNGEQELRTEYYRHFWRGKPRAKSIDHITKDEEENEGEAYLKYSGVACAFKTIPVYNFVFTVAAFRYYSGVFLFQNGLCHATTWKAKKILVLPA
jgi:hypothetical protein